MALIDKMCQMVGFDQGEGIFSPGGSLAILACLILARSAAYPSVKQHGLLGDPSIRPGRFFTSVQSHYSVERAASILGFGTESVVKIPAPRGVMSVVDLGLLIADPRSFLLSFSRRSFDQD